MKPLTGARPSRCEAVFFVGAGLGYMWPLIEYHFTRGELGGEELVDGTRSEANQRAVIGAVVGGLAAAGVAVASSRKGGSR